MPSTGPIRVCSRSASACTAVSSVRSQVSVTTPGSSSSIAASLAGSCPATTTRAPRPTAVRAATAPAALVPPARRIVRPCSDVVMVSSCHRVHECRRGWLASQSGPDTDASGSIDGAALAPPGGMRVFVQVLINTAVANVTTSFLWFALTFWAYLETRSVLATGLIGGAYMLLIALFGMLFGTVVDRHRKHRVMVFSGFVTLVAFLIAGALFVALGEATLVDLGGPWFWIFSSIILLGAVVENLRNIALSTTVTLLVPVERHANANGLVGTVQGMAFMVTSIFSGLAIGLLGMGWTLLIALVLTAAALVHLLFIRIPEDAPAADDREAAAHRLPREHRRRPCRRRACSR